MSTTTEKIEWQDADECRPADVGWYPATLCFDVEEGIFATAMFWTSDQWTEEPENPRWWSNGFYRVLPQRQASKEAAHAFAEQAYDQGIDQ